MSKIKILFIIVFLAQLSIPLSMIIQKEMVLTKGELVKFQVEPVDPHDAFRGKYLNIGVVEDLVYTETDLLKENQTVYGIVYKDSMGFSYFHDITINEPDDGIYIKCSIDYVSSEYVTLTLPFDRYYINEEYNQLGEDLYNRYSRGDKKDAYITVRIKKGKAVLENMYLADIEINKFIEMELKKD